MRIKDRPEYKTKSLPMTAKKNCSVFEASKMMREKNYGSIVIIDNKGELEGLFTERDLLNRVVADGVDPKKIKLADVMSKDIRVANEQDDILDWLRIMSNERFRRLPIVDHDGKFKAIITQGDFVSYTWPDLVHQAKELTKASLSPDRSLRAILLIGGGILLYTLLLIIFGVKAI